MQIADTLVELVKPRGVAVRREQSMSARKAAASERAFAGGRPSWRGGYMEGSGMRREFLEGAETEPLELERRGGDACARIDT